MMELWNKLRGKRTYLAALGIAILEVIFRLDTLLHDNPETKDIVETAWITVQYYESIGTLLIGGGAMALRAAIANK